MDGTRVVRIIELYNNKYLVGEMFPPSVRSWPKETELVKASNWEQVQDYVLSVRASKRLAAEAYSFDFVDTTGKYSDMLIGSIPEATSGVTGEHIYSIMIEVEKQCAHYGVPLVGHCTDSASNALNALININLHPLLPFCVS
jgi:CTP synthase (UTP-ammonia lyase)